MYLYNSTTNVRDRRRITTGWPVRRSDLGDLVSDPRGYVLVLDVGIAVTKCDGECHGWRASH